MPINIQAARDAGFSDDKIIAKLSKDFPEKYKRAVLRSAELCTVKKHLENPPQITIELTEDK